MRQTRDTDGPSRLVPDSLGEGAAMRTGREQDMTSQRNGRGVKVSKPFQVEPRAPHYSNVYVLSRTVNVPLNDGPLFSEARQRRGIWCVRVCDKSKKTNRSVEGRIRALRFGPKPGGGM